MSKQEKEIKKLCTCENCGNEAEMVVTCTLPDSDPEKDESKTKQKPAENPEKIKGTATCTHCGNEADMWIDL